MPALGCFIPFITVVIGAAVGSYLGDIRGGYIGAAAGLAAGIAMVGIGFMLLDKVRRI